MKTEVEAGGLPPLKIVNVTFAYAGSQTPVLENFSLDLGAGEGLLLSGHNGAGKSTVFRLILGLEVPQAGSVEVFGERPDRVRELVSFLPQTSSTDWNSPLSVAQLVASSRPGFLRPFLSRVGRTAPVHVADGQNAGDVEPGSNAGPTSGPKPGRKFKPAEVDSPEVLAALRDMDLLDIADKPVSELSGGQRQRATFARTLARGGRLLLLDEPFNHLDEKTRRLSVRALEAALADGKTIILAEHETDLLGSLLTRSVALGHSADGDGAQGQHAHSGAHRLSHEPDGNGARGSRHQVEENHQASEGEANR